MPKIDFRSENEKSTIRKELLELSRGEIAELFQSSGIELPERSISKEEMIEILIKAGV